MESASSWLDYTAWLASLTLLLLLSDYIWHRRKLNLPPGPKPWPVIGNFNLIGSLPHRSFHKLTKQYGPLMMLRLGSHRVLVASSVELAKFILKTQDLSFASRPKTAAGYYTTYSYSAMIWSPYGPHWRQGCKMFLMELFNAKSLESYEYIRIEEMNSLLKGLFDSSGRTLILKDYLSNLTLNVIGRMVLGKWYVEAKERSIVTHEEFRKMLDEMFLLNGVLNIGDWIPYLGFLDLQGYVKRMKCVATKFDRLLELVLDEHEERKKKEKENWFPKDMIDVLLSLANDPNLEVMLERQGIKGFTMDLIGGGTETASTTLEWAISELVKNPKVARKAVQELESIIGNQQWVHEKDIPNLPYIRAIVKETMRLHPVGPLLIPRIARQDVTIFGYDVPKETRVFVNTWAIQRDPQIYEDPEKFYPERFVGKSYDVTGKDFEFLPFGSGRRMCPGYSLGLKIVELNLANLVHGFVWCLPNNMKHEDLDMEEVFGLTCPKKIPLLIVPKPRLSAHLYNL